jgi:hypothetical protein
MLFLGAISIFLTSEKQIEQPVQKLTHEEFESNKNKLIYILEKSGLDEAFTYTRSQIESNPSFARDCHPLLHTLGHASFKISLSFESAMENSDELCNSGYIHGLIEANFESASTIDEALTSSCNDYSVENFKNWQCFHGIGHGIMYTNTKNHIKSLEDCNRLKSNFAIESCINGVFMEEFILVDHMGGYDTKITDVDVSICKELSSTSSKSHCYFYAPTAYLQLSDSEFKDAIMWCTNLESNFIGTCISGVGAQSIKDNISNPQFTSNLCEETDTKYQTSCVSGAISMYINHFASSSNAESLCSDEFNKFSDLCFTVVKNNRRLLKI